MPDVGKKACLDCGAYRSIKKTMMSDVCAMLRRLDASEVLMVDCWHAKGTMILWEERPYEENIGEHNNQRHT